MLAAWALPVSLCALLFSLRNGEFCDKMIVIQSVSALRERRGSMELLSGVQKKIIQTIYSIS